MKNDFSLDINCLLLPSMEGKKTFRLRPGQAYILGTIIAASAGFFQHNEIIKYLLALIGFLFILYGFYSYFKN
ncbi:hypothetical protein [Mesonia sp. K7]|uniref:hypothetical protein n=1 Tax=Mesonia sp. K7 TaxID=2218606 RepID=UPI000DAAA286|nr:hypothetical protein [Mesonia sp. K7]PZD79064.1 hypothetical protein DNG35_03385 [Mesonia sp. K7]